jgi:hypothetical protein
MAEGFVEDALAACSLYGIPLTQALCECILNSTEEFLKIKQKQSAANHAERVSRFSVSASVSEQLIKLGNDSPFRVMPKVRVMVETARVEDERKRIADTNQRGGAAIPTTREASVAGTVSGPQQKKRFPVTAKEFLLFVVGTALALGSYKTDDAIVVCVMLGIASLAFIILCVIHPGKVAYRSIAAVAFLAALIFIGWRDLRHPSQTANGAKPPQSPRTSEPLTLKDLYRTDFSNAWGFGFASRNIVLPDGTNVPFEARLLIDPNAAVKFASFYLPSHARAYEACLGLPQLIGDAGGLNLFHLEGPGAGTESMHSKDYVFSRRVFIYHENFFSPEEEGKIHETFSKRRLQLELRGDTYLQLEALRRGSHVTPPS